MAHYAIINEQNTVIEVRTGVDEDVVQNGVGGSTEAWEAFYTEQLKNPTLFVKRCSYNGSIRGKYPAKGDIWDGTHFVAPVVPEIESEV
jgi:hypothetical protein